MGRMILFVIVGVYFFLRFRSFADPSGEDGYFYLKQIESLSSFSGFYYKDYSLAFLPLALLNFIVSDPLLTFQIGTSIVWSLIGVFAYRLSRKYYLGQSRRLAIVLSLAFVVFAGLNQPFLEVTFAYFKTGFAVLLLLVSGDRLLSGSRRAALVAFLLALLSHKFVAIFAAITIVCVVIEGLAKRVTKMLLLAASVIAFLFVALVHQRFSAHFAEIIRSLDYSKYSLAVAREMPHHFGLMLLFGLTGLTLLASSLREEVRHRLVARVVGFGLLVPALVPDELNTTSVTFRMIMVAAPLFLTAVGILISRRGFARKPALVLLAAGIVLSGFSLRPLNELVPPWSKRMSGEAKIISHLPPRALLYAPHGLEFYLAAKTPIRPRSLMINPGSREVFRVAYVAPYLNDPAVSEDVRRTARLDLGQEFALYKENEWESLIERRQLKRLKENQLLKKPDFVAGYDD